VQAVADLGALVGEPETLEGSPGAALQRATLADTGAARDSRRAAGRAGAGHVVRLAVAVVVRVVADLDGRVRRALTDERAVRAAREATALPDADAALAARAARATHGAAGQVVDRAVAVVVEAVAGFRRGAGPARAHRHGATRLTRQRTGRADARPAEAVAR